MLQRLKSFIQENIIKKRFNSNATKIKFWESRGSLDLYYFIKTLHPNLPLQEQCFLVMNEEVNDLCSCGNKTKFISFNEGYSNFCSKSCSQKSPDTRKKFKETMIERYGKETMLCGDTTQMAKIKHGKEVYKKANKKAKSTKLKKYGDENFNNPDKNKETRKNSGKNYSKLQKEVASRYKEEHGLDIMNSARKAFVEKYEVSNPSEVKEILDKKSKNSQEKYGLPYQGKHLTPESYKLINSKEYLESNSVRQIMEETGFSQSQVSKYMLKNGVSDEFRSSGEKEIYNFIKNFYDGEILINKRSIFGFEIDIFIPEFNFGIEYNGSYWHSDNFVKTHKNKYDALNERGQYLLQIFDFQWKDEILRDIIKSKIKLKMGIYDKKIFARKCEKRGVSPQETKKFLIENHLQGFVKSSFKFGLYYENELVSLMTFGKSRFKSEFELIRFVNKKNCIIIGGASKLFKYALKELDIGEIVSFADNFYSNGNLYKILGFKKESVSQGFFYLNIKDGTKVNRFNFQKHKLPGIFKDVDLNLSGSEIVKRNGYYRIFDAGQTKYHFKLNKPKEEI